MYTWSIGLRTRVLVGLGSEVGMCLLLVVMGVGWSTAIVCGAAAVIPAQLLADRLLRP